MSTTHAADRTVVDLESHAIRHEARRYSEAVAAAMRRHPSFQSTAGHHRANPNDLNPNDNIVAFRCGGLRR